MHFQSLKLFCCATSDFLRLQFQVKKEMLLTRDDLQQFQNHSSQMAALDFMVSVASDTFIPTYDGNMAKLVEGHRRYVFTPNVAGMLLIHYCQYIIYY